MRLNRHHDQSGQGSVELALCLPVFLLLIAGTAEIANIAWASVQLNNAAHAGAQFGSLNHANADNPSQIETAAQNEAPFTITFPTAPAQTCVCTDGSGTPQPTRGCTLDATTGCPSPTYTMQIMLQVSVQAVVKPIVHYPGLPASYTMNATANTPVINE